MKYTLLEVLGVFLIVLGCGGLVAAAAFVPHALAVLVASVELVLAGAVVVYLAAALERVAETKLDGRQ
jgi:hypothetical protein